MINLFYSYIITILKKFIHKVIINDYYINLILKSYLDLNKVLTILKLHNQFNFKILTDVACVDFLNFTKHRFELNYILSSLVNRSRLLLTIVCDETSIIESSTNIYASSN